MFPFQRSNYGGKHRRIYSISDGRRIFLYRNLSRKFDDQNVVYSLRSEETVPRDGCFDALETGHVFHHTRTVTLSDCRFRVSTAGRKTVLATRRKQVHAGIVGNLINWDEHIFPTLDTIMANEDWSILSYNPYRDESFVEIDKAIAATGCIQPLRKVYEADQVVAGSWRHINNMFGDRSLILAKNIRASLN